MHTSTHYRLVEENLRVAMRCYGNLGGVAEVRDIETVSIASSGIDFPVFNSAMLSGPVGPGGLARAVSVADVHFTARRLGWTFWLCDDLLPPEDRYNARHIFRGCNMSPIARPPGMFVDRITTPERQLPELECRRVSDRATRYDFAMISSMVFSLPTGTSLRIYGSEDLWQSPMTGWIAYWNGNPVGLVSVVIGAGCAGIYSLGTLQEHRRRGFGEALMRHALAATREETGIESSVLQTTSQGMKLYLRLGYRIVANFSVYMQEGCGLR